MQVSGDDPAPVGGLLDRPPGGPPAAAPDSAAADSALAARLRDGDERAFAEVVSMWSPVMVRVARSFVSTDASAQEVVQDTWLAVIRGLDGFEGRSSLRTWTFRILTNTAKTRGIKESRTSPWSSLVGEETGPTVDPARFRAPGQEWEGNWAPAGVPQPWDADPEQGALRGELRAVLAAAVEELPERQRTVVVLRDVQQFDSDEVCELLGISPENQRVLLHRGRAKLRAALEDYFRRENR